MKISNIFTTHKFAVICLAIIFCTMPYSLSMMILPSNNALIANGSQIKNMARATHSIEHAFFINIKGGIADKKITYRESTHGLNISLLVGNNDPSGSG